MNSAMGTAFTGRDLRDAGQQRKENSDMAYNLRNWESRGLVQLGIIAV